MPLVLDGSVVQFVVQMELAQQQVLNVYNYYIDDEVIAVDLIELITGLRENFLDDLLLLATVSLEVNQINVAVLGSPVFREQPVNLSGVVVGDRMPTFTSVVAKFPRTSKETRSGFKRIAGVTALEVLGDNLLESTQIAYQAACDGMVDPITITRLGGDVAPIILGKRFEPSGEEKPVSEWEWQYITSVLVEDRVSTQNSRKVGRGA